MVKEVVTDTIQTTVNANKMNKVMEKENIKNTKDRPSSWETSTKN
jgi:uncharacterized membrane protein